MYIVFLVDQEGYSQVDEHLDSTQSITAVTFQNSKQLLKIYDYEDLPEALHKVMTREMLSDLVKNLDNNLNLIKDEFEVYIYTFTLS